VTAPECWQHDLRSRGGDDASERVTERWPRDRSPRTREAEDVLKELAACQNSCSRSAAICW
jgi:hypothetical protein